MIIDTFLEYKNVHYDIEIDVDYSVTKGFKGSYFEPPEYPEVIIKEFLFTVHMDALQVFPSGKFMDAINKHFDDMNIESICMKEYENIYDV